MNLKIYELKVEKGIVGPMKIGVTRNELINILFGL